jgi:voltage-gated potassium channel
MVQLLIRPGVIDFIDGVARERDMNISLEEIKICENSVLIGMMLKDSPIRKDLNIIIVAINKKSGSFIYNPKPDTKFEEGDKLIAIGEKESLSKLNKICLH